MKHVLFTLLMCISLSASAKLSAEPSQFIITTGTELFHELKAVSKRPKVLGSFESTTILQTDQDTLSQVAALAHTQGKCGGFFIHETLEEARKSITASIQKTPDSVYRIRDSQLVKTLLPKVSEANIQTGIRKLSSYHNRYYKSETGVQAATDLAKYWEQYGPTELYHHKSWKQPSVITTITGSKFPDEVIVLGGHLDSISGFFGGSTARAPGADDNASGISTITEVLRILSEAKYKPLRTIKFMGYAAEEVGLRGSAEIARSFKDRKVKVVGAMQLDMTNYKGSDKTIYLTTDYTNESQTKFLAKLIDTYVQVPHDTTRCGYACSDHASWNRAGYPAVFPFEAGKGDMNKKIHTKNDTIEVSGGNAEHATSFAKLAIAYLIEMDLQSVDVTLK